MILPSMNQVEPDVYNLRKHGPDLVSVPTKTINETNMN